jgi:hypothetical protein
MTRSNDAEVPPVERGDPDEMQSFGCGNDGGVHRTEREIAVARGELGHTQPIVGVDRLRLEGAGSQVTEEPHLRFGTQPRGDEIGDLADDEHRDDQRPRMGLEKRQALAVVSVVSVDVGVERTSVD